MKTPLTALVCLTLLVTLALAQPTDSSLSTGAETLLGADSPKLPTPGAVLVLMTPSTGSIDDSVLLALNQLGVTYDYLETIAFDTVDFSPYDTVILAADGGTGDLATWNSLTSVAATGKRLVFIGGSAWQPFQESVNANLVYLDTNYSWTIPSTPHFTLTNAASPLAVGVPATHDFADASAAYYMGRCTDAGIAQAAENGDGWPCLFSKRIGTGVFAWFINNPEDVWWTDPGDFAVLKQIIWNLIHVPAANVLVIETLTDVEGSIGAALTDLGYTYDWAEGHVDDLNLSAYDTVVVGMDGGYWNDDDMTKVAAFVGEGGRFVCLGGSSSPAFHQAVDDHLFDVDDSSTSWVSSATPHFTVLYDQNRLAVGLPSPVTYNNTGATKYALRPMGGDVQVAAENGDGWPCLVKKRIGAGWLAWFTHTPTASYWTDPADYAFLRSVIFNMMHVEERAVRLDYNWNMISYPALDPEEAVHCRLCWFQTGSTRMLWSAASAAGWFQDPGFYYTPGVGYGAIGLWPMADDLHFRYGKGYWFLCYGKPGTVRYLLFPGPR